MHLFYGERNCRDFLHELGADLFGDAAAARAGHEHAGVVAIDPDFFFHAAQKLQSLFRLLGFVALVILPQNLIGRRVNDGSFHCGRADVEPDQKVSVMVVRSLRRQGGDLQ